METIIWEDAPGEPPGFQSTNFKDFSEKTQEDLANKMLKQKLLDLIAELD